MTVVTVALNDLQGIRRTLDSLRTQTYRSVQHVIIDGGSTDGTAEWARTHAAFADTRVVSEPDDGIYDAMNKGLSMASGSLICFLNSGDEYIDDSVLERVAHSYDKERWRWAYGFSKMVDEAGVRVAAGRVRQRHSWLRQTFWAREICHQATFIEVSFARELGGFDAQYRIAADFLMLARAGRLAAPHVFDVVIVDVLAGGVSEARHWPSQFEAHKARVEVLRLGKALATVDLAWTGVMTARSLSRRRVGRIARRLRQDVTGVRQ